MTQFRDDFIQLADDCRRDLSVEEFGTRLFSVVIRTRTWDGGEVGRGTPTDVDFVPDPVPRVRDPSPRELLGAQGRYEDGDRVADRISATYTEAQLDGGAIAPGSEVYWLIDGEPWRVMRKPLVKYLQWHVQLRAMQGR